MSPLNLKQIIPAAALVCMAASSAQIDGPDGITMGGNGDITGLRTVEGTVPPPLVPLLGQGLTNNAVRDRAISIGQLAGIDPQTGEWIADPDSLMPYVGTSLQIVDSNGNTIVGIDSSGLNIWDAAQSRFVPIWIDDGKLQLGGATIVAAIPDSSITVAQLDADVLTRESLTNGTISSLSVGRGWWGRFSPRLGVNSMIVGGMNTASNFSFASGIRNEATGFSSHAEGSITKALGASSHAEGSNTEARGSYSHAEGYFTKALGQPSHAEGYQTVAYGSSSHAEGNHTYATGICSHAEGYLSEAGGVLSHAAGALAKADHDAAFVWSSSGAGYQLEFASTTNRQFNVYADNGIRLITGSNGTVEIQGQILGDGSGLTNLNMASVIPNGAITSEMLAEDAVSSMTILDETIGNAHIADDAAIALSKIDGLEAILDGLQQQAAAVYNTAASITVQVTDDEMQNGINLINAYAQAAGMQPSASSRVAVIVPPGRYNLQSFGLHMNTEYVDLIGQTTDREAQYLYGQPGLNNGVIKQSADYVRIENLRLAGMGSDSMAYFPNTFGHNTVVRNCMFESGDYDYSMRGRYTYAGHYEDCVAGYWAFGGSGTASGTFISCEGGPGAFGGDGGRASGTFISCEGGEFAFGGGGTANGTFIQCKGDYGTFGGEGTASGRFTDCTAAAYSFGGYGIASGTFDRCEGGESAFGGDCGTASGSFFNCKGGNAAFGGYYGTASGTFKNCKGGQRSFGGDYEGGINSGLALRAVVISCSADANSFGQFDMAAANFNYNASGHTFAGGPILTGPYGDIPMFGKSP
jgi:hypothetical protein